MAAGVGVTPGGWAVLHRMAATGAPGLRRKVLEALTGTVTGEQAAAIRAALAAGDLDRAVRAIPWGPDWNPDLRGVLTGELRGLAERAGVQAFKDATAALDLPVDPTRLPLSLVNERAVAYAETTAAARVVEIGRATREGLRQLLADGLEDGLSPMVLARQIREQVGLTDAQAAAVTRFRRGMERDGFTREKAQAAAGKYADKLLRVRAENIARTETQDAVNAGEDLAWQTARDAGIFPEGQAAEWIATDDARLCPICASLVGQRVALGEDFQADTGETFTRPPAHPQCRCARVLVLV